MVNQMEKRKLSLYIHIPFCVRKCNYCDFLSFSASEEEKEHYVQALCEEIESFSALENGRVCLVQTIFFGGGTPSVLNVSQIEQIMDSVQKTFTIDSNAEITIEMNPGTVTREKLETYRKIGINRLSIGLQTTNDKRLKVLGRIHTFEQFLQNYQMAREVGFDNISVDLMSALPNESIKDYQKDLERVLALEPEHISSYSLIIEEGTPFYNNDEILNQLPEEEDDRQMYELTDHMLREKNYYRYEISNYAKVGKESRHNSVYWTGGEYLGLGLGASSYLRQDHPYLQRDGGKEEQSEENRGYYGVRFKNNTVLTEYLSMPYTPIMEREEVSKITEQEAMEEFMFLGLRMMKGIKRADFFFKFHRELETVYGDVINKFIGMGLLEEKEDWIRFTKKGIDVSNSVFCEFLQDS